MNEIGRHADHAEPKAGCAHGKCADATFKKLALMWHDPEANAIEAQELFSIINPHLRGEAAKLPVREAGENFQSAFLRVRGI